MKQIIMLVITFLMYGCAMGINHNTVVIDGKTYLVETKNNGILWAQWSEISRFIPLDGAQIEQVNLKHSLQEIKNECQQMLPSRAGNAALYKCINSKIK